MFKQLTYIKNRNRIKSCSPAFVQGKFVFVVTCIQRCTLREFQGRIAWPFSFLGPSQSQRLYLNQTKTVSSMPPQLILYRPQTGPWELVILSQALEINVQLTFKYWDKATSIYSWFISSEI